MLSVKQYLIQFNKPKSKALNVIGEEVFMPHIKKNLTPGANKGAGR